MTVSYNFDPPDKLLRDNPFIPGRNNLPDLGAMNNALVGGDWANKIVAAKAALMHPDVAVMYNRWATAHPHANPRTWAPLAEQMIDPWSEAGVAIVNADVTGAVANGTYDKFSGAKVTDPPKNRQPDTRPTAEEQAADDSGGSWWSRLASGAVSRADDLKDTVLNVDEAAVRGAEAGLSFPIQAWEATARTNLGSEAHRTDALTRIGERKGLSPDEVGDLNSIVNAEGASLTSAQDNIDKARQFLPQLVPDPALQAKYNQVLDAYSRVVSGGASERFAGSEQSPGKVVSQTDVGIVARSFRDGIKGNYLTSRPETGSVFDPKTGKWVNPDTGKEVKWVDHGGIFLPTEERTEAENEAIKAYDIRTAEERKNGVAPVAWTLGRGIAHSRYSADDQAFSLMSGYIDFQKSLFLDPVNLVPMGWAAKIGRGATTAGKAFSQYGDDIVVATRGAARAGTEAVPSAVGGARTGARVAAQGSDKELFLDPMLSSRGYLLEGSRVVKPSEGGLVNVPHAKFVAKRAAWNYLNTGKGARAVDELAQMTSPTQIWLRSNRRLDGDLAIKLADATTPEEVRAILGSRLGVDITDARTLGKIGGITPGLSKVPGIGPALVKGFDPAGAELASGQKSAWRTNFERGGVVGAVRGVGRSPFRLAPSSGVGVDAEDVDSVLSEFERFFRGIRTNDATVTEAMDNLLRAPNGIARYNAIYDKGGILDKVNAQLVAEHGIDPSYAHKITRAYASGLNPELRDYLNSDLGAASFGAATADGEIGRPILLNEMHANRLYLPDYRTLRRTTGYLKNIEHLAGASAAEKSAMASDFLLGITSVWRDWTLLRPAYMLRELGELSFSMSLAGGPGAFTHPYGFIAQAVQSSLAWNMHTLPGKVFGGAAAAPGKLAETGMDAAQRFLIARKTEREAFLASARLPDKARPEVLRGVNPSEAAKIWDNLDETARSNALWETVDRKALKDYLMLHEGAAWLMPHVNSRWARVNGKQMYDEFMKALDGDQQAYAQFQHELNFAAGNMVVDEPAMRGAARNVKAINRDVPETRKNYVHALIDSKLTRVSQDNLMRKLAQPDADPMKIAAEWHGTSDWAMRREMNPDLWKTHPDKQLADVSLGEDIQYITGYGNMLQKVTGGDRELLDAVAKGTFDGNPLTAKNRALVNYLSKRMDDEKWANALPNVLHEIDPAGRARSGYQHMVNRFFTQTGELSDIFGRSPMVRFFYTQWVKDNAPFLSAAARQQAVENLRKAGDTKLAREVLRADTRIKRPNVGTLGVDEMEAAASGYARRQTSKVFYNAHRRQNYTLAMRVLSPFIQATLNTFKRWAVLSLQNPQLAYRTLKPIEHLREPGSAVIYEALGDITGDKAMQGMYTPGHPEASVDGFFLHNEYGQRVFAFPGVRQVYNLIAGKWNPVLDKDIPEGAVPLAQAANLNVAGGTLNPGMGPLVTFPASMVLRDTIYEDNFAGKIERALFPYGLPQGGWLSKGIQSFAPTFLRKSVIPEDMQANHTSMMLPTLAASGEYDLSKQSEIRRMISDAKELSGRMDTFAAFFGGVTPTTFNWQYAIEASNGDKGGAVRWFMMADKLAQEWRQYTAPKSEATWREDYNNGALNFIKDYGLFAFYSVMPRTEQPGVPFAMAPTADIWSFRTDEPQAYEQHRGVIGLFFPGGDPAGEWGSGETNLYAWQKAAGERTYKSPDDYWEDANTSLGWIKYATAQKEVMTQVSDPAQQSVLMADYADQIERKFPGWTPEGTNPGRFTKILTQLEDAVQDDAIQTLPGTPYIAKYLDARRDAIQSLRDVGQVGTLSSDYASAQRAQLLGLATHLVRQDTSGTFAYAWSRFFSDELTTEGAQ